MLLLLFLTVSFLLGQLQKDNIRQQVDEKRQRQRYSGVKVKVRL